MKNLYNILLVLFSLLVITSCNDDEFLKQKSPDELNSSSFWRDETDAQSGLVAAYAELEARSSFWDGWQEGRPVIEWFRSDHVNLGVDRYTHWSSIYNFSYTNGHTFVNLIWRLNYRGINAANQVITRVGEMTSDQISDQAKKQIIAEATFLRGYYHFKLLSLYEQIVVRTEMVTAETLDSPLSTRAEAWGAIISDFKTASENLTASVSSENIGRATKGAALAYLGKAYLHKAGDPTSSETNDFEGVVNALKPIVDGTVGDYALETDFRSQFNGENENNSESIFELQFKTGDATSWNATALHFFIGDGAIGGWGGIEGNQGLLQEMKSEGKIASEGLYDARLYGSLFFKDEYFNSGDKMQGYNWDQLMTWQYEDEAASKDNSVYFRKFIPNDIWSVWTTGLNVVLMRHADVLLMYAEALNENGQTSVAIPIINDVRATHGNMPTITASTQSEVKAQIIHERTMEFTLESSRFNDLRRWGLLDQAMQTAGRSNFSSAAHAYLPVPLSEINANSNIN